MQRFTAGEEEQVRRGRKLFSRNRRYQCSVCYHVSGTFPSASRHLVQIHNGEGVIIKLMP